MVSTNSLHQKFNIGACLVAFLMLCFSLNLTAVESSSALSDAERDSIMQNCPAIRQSLSRLQKADSKVRTYLGTSYETIATKFITPLNLRLVKNNRATLSDIQADFTSQQSHFRDAYTTYMRDLESLIAVDCQSHPDEFYDRLIEVRKKRATLHDSAIKMSRLAHAQYDAVLKLRNSL